MSFRRAIGAIAFASLSLAGVGCSSFGIEEGSASPAPHSDRGGIGLSTVSQGVVSPSQVINARRSLAVTDQTITTQFTLLAVMDQLAAQNGNPAFTGTQLFRQMWETQNAAVGPADLQPSAHCSDNGTSLNGFANICRPTEGAQANAANATNINSYSAIGLFNRFDLAPGDGSNCGEYRVVFGKTGGGGGRSFIIFEAILPNPRLSNNPSVPARATALRNFYFNGLPGHSPVLHMSNYGFNFAAAGQIRINMFMGGAWDLKEFKLERQCPGGVCKLKAVPATVKTNPFGDLFNPASFNALAGDFQTHFLTQVGTLALNDVNRFNYEVPDQFNNPHSDAQSGGVEDDYLANFAGASAFRTAIQGQLTALGSALTPDNIVARAQALSCGGCHQRSSGAGMGGGITFPNSASFVHSSEFLQASPDGGNRFILSTALDNVFLPFRKNIVEEFLSAVHPITTITRFDMVGSAADGVNGYWAENRPSGSIVKASLNSGSEQAIAFNRANPTALATDGVNVYWNEASGSIFKVSVNGGTVTTLTTGVPVLAGIATDGVNVYWSTSGATIARMPVAGGAITNVITGRAGITSRLAVDATSVYWQEGNNILKAPKAGGAVTTLITRASITGLASDGTNVYLAENLNPGNILRLPVGGGAVTNMFSGSFNLTSVAVGATNFVWTSNTSPGPVMTKVKQ
jgi:hypothetical protein